jgi:homoserine O-acetyltransferase
VKASNTPDWRKPASHEFTVRDFRFHTGEVLPEMRLAYTVLGHPDRKPVLALHGTGSKGTDLLADEFGGHLFGPGGPLDAAEHFIVLPDAIGHGCSAKPSDGLRAAFPRYNYEDMVEGQYRVVSEALGIRHLRVVIGLSMGGMHTWLWGTRRPGFMDALVTLASLPAPMSGRNWLLRLLLIDQIRSDPQWAQGNYLAQPSSARRALEFFNAASNGGTLALQAAIPNPARADEWLKARRALPFHTDANDLLYQYEASRDYDPSQGLEHIRAYVLAINSSDDERTTPETGLAQQAIDRLTHGRQILLPGNAQTCGHGTVRYADLWTPACRDFLNWIPPWTGSPGSEVRL